MLKRIFILILSLVSTLSHSSSIEITTETPEVSPRSVVTIIAEPSSENAREFLLMGPNGFKQMRYRAPFIWTLNMSKKFHGERLYQVVGVVDEKAVMSNDLVVMVKPDLDKMFAMEFRPARVNLLQGLTYVIRLIGKFEGGLEYDVGRYGWVDIEEMHVDGYTELYRDSENIELLPGGKIKALNPGEAGVRAKYKHLYADFRFEVVASENPAFFNESKKKQVEGSEP